jgi:hypothetical protein
MPSIYSLLQSIPDELKPWAAMGVGGFILVCLVMIHGIGIHRILSFHKGGERRLLKGKPHVFRAMLLFGLAVFLLLLLHLVEVVAWAFVLIKMGLIERAHDAIYFCANAYTTLGLGTLDINPQWRNISPIIGISGLFTFAWTTSALVGVVGGHNRLLEQLHEEREKQKELRVDLRKAIGETRTRENEAEKAEESAAREKMAGAGLKQRWGIWQEEKKKVMGMRKEELKEIAELYRKEQAEEEKLGPGDEEKNGAKPK